jgi:hypothetical protein
VALRPPQTSHVLTGREPGRPRWEPATNRLSYGTVYTLILGQGQMGS